MSKKYEKFNINYFTKEERMGMRDAYIPIYLPNVEVSQISCIKAFIRILIKFYF